MAPRKITGRFWTVSFRQAGMFRLTGPHQPHAVPDPRARHWPSEEEPVMKDRLLIAAGIVVVIVGAVFALQGFGVINGSAMSNNHTFEVVGPLIALAGLALSALGLRHRGSAAK